MTEAIIQPPEPTVQPPVVPPVDPPAAPPAFTWKSMLAPDYANSPTMSKFPDTKEGFNEAVKSHLSLEQLLGHEKVPVPKGPDDKEGWTRFSKAFGVPEKPEGYSLPDADIPESMKGVTFDKGKFGEAVHKFNLTPDQAKGVWGAYTEMVKGIYASALRDHQQKMQAITNAMRQEYGEAYDSNVELGQLVINKFSADKEENDFITSTLSKDARGIRFLAKIGQQFAENKVGDFANKRFSLTPQEAQAELDKILSDPSHPYINAKAPQAEHDRAVEYVNSLHLTISKARG